MQKAKLLDFDAPEADAEFHCPACGDAFNKTRMLVVRGPGGSSMSLFKCARCSSLVYHPLPSMDYTEHTNELAVRNYVEMNASIDTVGRNILKIVRTGRKGRMLDVGCGFGFALDILRTVSGWEVKGFEPSQYGAAGRDQLGIDIVNDFAGYNVDPGDLYNVVHCSEVIEHIHDPSGFVSILVSYLAPDGVLVLTTPDPGRIHSETETSTLLALLSPGAHTVLLSDVALTDLLRQAGLEFVTVDKSSASTLLYASRKPIKFQHNDAWEASGISYLRAAHARAKPGSSLEIGLRYRLFRGAIDRGMYHLAEEVYAPYLADPKPQLDDINVLADFAGQWPLCIAASTYYQGMLLLIHYGNYEAAGRHFVAAYALCQKLLDIAPHIAAVEADLIWRAKYHQALASKLGGKDVLALSILECFEAPALDPHVPADLLHAIAALRESLDGTSATRPASQRQTSAPFGHKSISAIIPLYNGAHFIETSLRSVLEQTRPPDEVVIVDDGSDDDGAETARKIANGDSRVKIIFTANGGQSSARNLGVRHSTGAFIAFLDQDDWWYPKHLEILERAASEPQSGTLGWVYSDLDEYNSNGELVVRKMLRGLGTEHPKTTLHSCLCADMYVLPSAALITRQAFEAVGGFDERLSGYEDDDLFLRMFCGGYINHFIDEPLSGWRIHRASSSYSPRMTQSAMVYANHLLDRFPDDVIRSRYYARDLIAPRFLVSALQNYKHAVDGDDDGGQLAATLADIDRLVSHMRIRSRTLIGVVRPLLGMKSFGRMLGSQKARSLAKIFLKTAS